MSEITITCIDSGKDALGHLLSIRQREYIEVAINTVKVRMYFSKGNYVGKMAGLEFHVHEDNLPKQYNDLRFRKNRT
jgi:hypothetical protein